MNTPTRASALLALLLAASASAQTAPAVSTSGSAYKNHIEAGYVQTDISTRPEDLTGYYVKGRYFVAGGLFLAAEYFDTDVFIPDSGATFLFSRLGLGAGYELPVGPGRLSAAATFGQLEFEVPGVGKQSYDQTRLSLTYEQTFFASLAVSLSLFHSLNGSVPSEGDLTAFVLGLGYDLGGGVSLQATYSPDAVLLGVDEGESAASFSVGLRYAF